MPADTLAEDATRTGTELAGPQPQTRAPLIELAAVEKVYRMGKVDYRALRGVDLSIAAGEMVAVVGPSGSGKTTILNLITGIDRPTAGALRAGAAQSRARRAGGQARSPAGGAVGR